MSVFENDIAPFIKKDDIGWVCMIDECGPFADIKVMINHFEILGLDPGEHDKKYKKFLDGCANYKTNHPKVHVASREGRDEDEGARSENSA